MTSKKKISFTREMAEKVSRTYTIPIDKVLSVLDLPVSILAIEVKTIEQAEQAYDRAPRGSEERIVALRKWREFSAKEIKVANTIEQAKLAYGRAPGGSEEKVAALRKLIDLSETTKQAEQAYNRAPGGSKEEVLAIRKLAQLIKK